MDLLFRAISAVTNGVTLAAFAIAALVWLAARFRGKVPRWVRGAIVLLVLLGVASWGYELWLAYGERAIYRVRVTVLSPQGMPVDDARVWSSVGGEPKKVAGGWQFDIPAATKPTAGKLVIYAALPAGFLVGNQELLLGQDYNPTVSVRLGRDTSATVSGIVMDETGKAIKGARVSVAGYEAEATTTGDNGNFTLPAHAADRQEVLVHAEKEGYKAMSQWHPAGRHPVTIVLDRGK